MMQALIVKDKFDNEALSQSLKKYLFENEIKHIVEISSFNEIDNAKVSLFPKEPCIFFPNIFIRYNTSLKDIINFHKENKFDYIFADNSRIISFIPEKITKPYKSTNFFQFSGNKFNSFKLNNVFENYVTPDENPIAFLSTHNRDMYLQLTLNSWDHSLIKKIPIKIFLNKPTDAVRQVALNFARNREYVEVLESNENTFFSAINILIQIFKPEKFILMEDDFIYPCTLKEYFPNWPFQFLDRLNHFDTVLWSASLDNVSSPYFNAPHCHELNQLQTLSDWIVTPRTKPNMLLAQSLAVKTDYYLSKVREHNNTNLYYCSFDSQLNSGNSCIPSLKGYHIGWNQQMDGFPSLTGRKWAPPVEICEVKSLTTGETRIVRPKDILEMSFP